MNPFSFAVLGFISIPFWVRQALGCQQINVSCSEVKTLNGFNFKHGSCPAGSKIYVYDNGTCMAYALFGNPPSLNLSHEVLRVDNGSVTTRSCRNITIVLIIPHGVIKGKPLVKETCVHFQTQPKTEHNDSEAPLTSKSIAGIAVTAAVIAGAIAMAWWCLKSRNTCLISDGHPPRSDEDNELQNTPQSVLIHSIEAAADTLQSPSLDCNLSNDIIQTTKDGDIGFHSAGRVSHHRSMNRNLRKDPGRVTNNKGEDMIKLDTGEAAGNHAEDHETEGQPLLSNQRAASFGMAGEARPLVNKVSFDKDPVSRCCAALKTDVESKNNVN